ncbi:hypothetical protein BDZ91DRAFT_714481 [Kalaharituber pfeilii]|nr:hypothetical protein BDZ91DRAFT_714481 [Kalaharituber pfeilii]
MAKLNYSNRKTSGLKLCSTVKRDLLKRAPEGSGLNAVKDPHLELSISGKALCDDGLQIVCEALCQTIQAGATKLEELWLSDNEITVRGLQWLVPLIKLCPKDLKDLDLSGNKILVETDQDVDAWENFLKSFRDVSCLRSFNLSNNPLGPDRAFETLLRCYSRENPLYLPKIHDSVIVDGSENNSDYQVDSSQETDSEDTDSLSGPKMHASSLKRELSSSPPMVYSAESTPSRSVKSNRGYSLSHQNIISPSPIKVELHGLRSVPYLILSNTRMRDISALHLSYLLAEHPLPHKVLPFFPTYKTSSQSDIFESYELESNCSGVIYLPNDDLTVLGTRALEVADSYRRDGCRKHGQGTRKTSEFGVDSPMRMKPGYFNTLLSVVGSTNDLDRSRSKIQGTILKEGGPSQIDLWKAALKALVLTRTLLLENETISPSSLGRNIPSCRRQDCLQAPISLQPVNHSSPPLQYSPPSPQSYKAYRMYLHNTLPSGLPVKSVTSLPGKLPEHIWQKIISLTADPQGTMSTQQLRNVHEWGRQRETLWREREFAGKLPSVQIWRFLEGLDCLTYEL